MSVLTDLCPQNVTNKAPARTHTHTHTHTHAQSCPSPDSETQPTWADSVSLRACRWRGECKRKSWPGGEAQCLRRDLHVMLDLSGTCQTSVLFQRGQQNACAGHKVWMCKTWLLIVNFFFWSDWFFFFLFNVLIMSKLWSLFFSIPFSPFLNLFNSSRLLFCVMDFNQTCNHCKDEATSPRCTKYCKSANMDSRGHCRDSPNCIVSVSSGFKPALCLPTVNVSSCLLFYGVVNVCILPSVHLQSVSSTLLLSRCQRSASVSMESCEYFYKGASNALSIYF